MLDAFIIDRIRRERQQREPSRLPLKVEIPERPPHRDGQREGDRRPESDDAPQRGVVIIDFGI
jgi:hypothetical protein